MNIDAKHPEYANAEEYWERIGLLASGGHRLLRRIDLFLATRPLEPSSTYLERVRRASYQNILAQALRWYVSKLFEDEAVLQPTSGETVTNELVDFWKTSNRRGNRSFLSMVEEIAMHALRDGSVWTLFDLPRPETQPATLAEQKARGDLRPKIKIFPASFVLNWEEDENGQLTQVTVQTFRAPVDEHEGKQVEQIWQYTRKEFKLFERARKSEHSKGEQPFLEIESGPHAMSAANRVPWHRVCLPETLFMCDQAYPLIIEHLNTSNALTWALLQSAFAIPVITGEFEGPPTKSETAYLQLTAGSTLTFAEPSGMSHTLLADRVRSLRDEIFRTFHLQAQSRDASATAQAASGESKAMDLAPSQDILRGLGAWLRKLCVELLDMAAMIAGVPPGNVQVRGWEFEDEEALPEAETAAAIKALDIPSDTFDRSVAKRVVRKYLGGADAKLIDVIEKEIDAAPTKEERDAKEQNERMQRFGQALKPAPEDTADDNQPAE